MKKRWRGKINQVCLSEGDAGWKGTNRFMMMVKTRLYLKHRALFQDRHIYSALLVYKEVENAISDVYVVLIPLLCTLYISHHMEREPVLFQKQLFLSLSKGAESEVARCC